MRSNRLIVRSIAIFLLALLSACGGGGGGGGGAAAILFSGAAAVGFPIVGGTVSITCASGNAYSATTDSNGLWNAQLLSTDLPCALRVSGGTVNGGANTLSYTSFATAAGVVNVTPLTDLMVANLVGTAAPATWFASLTPSTLSAYNANLVSAALNNLAASLTGLPLLTYNPVTASFTPGSGAMDNMLVALATAITNAGTNYGTLLTKASTTTSTTPSMPNGFGAALATAYGSGLTTYSIGGTVAGLTGTLTLQDSGGDDKSISSNGAFTFATHLPAGSLYNVTVSAEPAGQTCTVANGSSKVAGNVTGVAVNCTAAPAVNVLTLTVDAGPAAFLINTGYYNANVPYVTVTVCAPGSTTNCQAIDHVIVDTGSTGLRIQNEVLNSTLKAALTNQTDGSGHNLAECFSFVSSTVWGAVRIADVKMGGVTAASVPVQVVGDTSVVASPQGLCASIAPQDTVASFGANGLIGVSNFLQDCGSACNAANNGYYFTAASGSSSVGVATNREVQNPVAMLSSSSYNNGVIIQLPTVAAGGAATAFGTLTLGISSTGSATSYSLDSSGNFRSLYNSATLNAFADSGSNGLFFHDATIAACSGSLTGFDCPASTQSLSATVEDHTGANGTPVTFSVANAATLTTGCPSCTAFSNLAGPATVNSAFDWGLPFFYGRTVYTGFETTAPNYGYVAF